MCSILFSTRPVMNKEETNYFLKFRGPDHTEIIPFKDHTFLHNLLSICGSFTPQPISDGSSVLLFNGEIYNYKEFGDFDNDTKCILPLYKEYGSGFAKHLDGEFAIVIADYGKKEVLVSTDLFKTKPLFYSIGADGIGVSTYSTPLAVNGCMVIDKAVPNTTMIIDMESGRIKDILSIYDWQLNQHKDTFDDWIHAFEESIRKRTAFNREKIFIGMSSGYDSGSIAHAMWKQKIQFKGYSHLGSENMAILDSRKRLMSDYCSMEQYSTNPAQIMRARDWIAKTTEPFNYTVRSSRSDYNENYLALKDDNGSRQLSILCEKAKRDGYKIHMSGMGADEIFSDYGWNGQSKYPHSNFGGLFPEDLAKIFPWPSFYGSTMESYLAKEEYVGGSYGMESRYPFLDRRVVQEFLWLTSAYKNKYYKNVLHEYMSRNSFPFDVGVKIGF
jgi:asparagine synthetase B (glutamine-hydrolysing)